MCGLRDNIAFRISVCVAIVAEVAVPIVPAVSVVPDITIVFLRVADDVIHPDALEGGEGLIEVRADVVGHSGHVSVSDSRYRANFWLVRCLGI